MIGLYIKIAFIMMAVFGVLIIVVPAVYTLWSYITHIGKGNDFGSWCWENDYVLKNLEEFFTSLHAYDAEEISVSVICIILALSIFWMFGIPVFIYWTHCFVKKIQNEKYEDAVKNEDN